MNAENTWPEDERHGEPPLGRTARFAVFVNDCHVKLSLKPGESLSWGKSFTHEEGWASEHETWTHEGSHVEREWCSDGTDCDGRLACGGELECELDRLQAYEPHEDFVDSIKALGLTGQPDWQELQPAWKRDQYAEAMGY